MSTSIDDLPGNEEIDIVMQNNNNITPSIKKRVRFADEESIFSKIKNEFTEDNLLVLAFILIGSLPSTTQYIYQLPFIGQYATTDITTYLIKSVVLFFIYILSKIFILPNIKL
jgi:hypothetical protein